MTTIYADSMGAIHFRGGMIRIECGNFKTQDDVTSLETHTVLVMPVQGFLNVMKSGAELIEKMKETGAVVEKEKTEETNE